MNTFNLKKSAQRTIGENWSSSQYITGLSQSSRFPSLTSISRLTDFKSSTRLVPPSNPLAHLGHRKAVAGSLPSSLCQNPISTCPFDFTSYFAVHHQAAPFPCCGWLYRFLICDLKPSKSGGPPPFFSNLYSTRLSDLRPRSINRLVHFCGSLSSGLQLITFRGAKATKLAHQRWTSTSINKCRLRYPRTTTSLMTVDEISLP